MSGSGSGSSTTAPPASPTSGSGGSGNGSGGSQTIQHKPRSKGPVIAAAAVIVIIVIVVGAGYAAGWFKPAATAACGVTTKGTLLGEGSTLVAPLMDQWAASYWGGGVLTYDSVGSSSGISAITNKVADFGASDAPLTASQASAASGILEFPESAGGVVPIYNLPGGLQLNFNGSILANIFDGKITSWNNTPLQTLNPKADLPVEPITTVYRTGGSGTTFIFTSFLSADNHYWNVTYGKGTSWPTGIGTTGASGNGGEATAVATTTYAIGYVDLNYAITEGSGVEIGAVQNPSGDFIRATVANTESALVDINPTLPAGNDYKAWYNVSLLNSKAAGDYPITSLTYILVYANLNVYTGTYSYTATKAANLIDFLTYAVNQGQAWAPLLSYAPLPANIVAHDLTTIDSITFGTSSISVCEPTSTAPP